MDDPLLRIHKEHESIEVLFKEYEALDPETLSDRASLNEKILRELKLHTKMEEMLCYPQFAAILPPDQATLVADAQIEHQELKSAIDNIRAYGEEDLEKKNEDMIEIIRTVRAHIKEEEEVLFPTIRKHTSPKDAQKLHDELVVFIESRGGTTP